LEEAPPEEQEFRKTYNLPYELLRVLLGSYYTRTERMGMGLMEWARRLSLDRYEDEDEFTTRPVPGHPKIKNSASKNLYAEAMAPGIVGLRAQPL
jgi:hypothetical protein